jgi:threonine dehydratase
MRVRLMDQPGELAHMLNLIAGMRVNILDVHYQPISNQMPFMQHEAMITLETRNQAQSTDILQKLRAAGYIVEEVQALH